MNFFVRKMILQMFKLGGENYFYNQLICVVFFEFNIDWILVVEIKIK